VSVERFDRCLVFGLNYLDKTTLSYASIMGLKEDIHLVGDNYQWLGSIFYLGFLIWEVRPKILFKDVLKPRAFAYVLGLSSTLRIVFSRFCRLPSTRHFASLHGEESSHSLLP
jgi:ACS family allantoate permease-like MFS transporter